MSVWRRLEQGKYTLDVHHFQTVAEENGTNSGHAIFSSRAGNFDLDLPVGQVYAKSL